MASITGFIFFLTMTTCGLVLYGINYNRYTSKSSRCTLLSYPTIGFSLAFAFLCALPGDNHLAITEILSDRKQDELPMHYITYDNTCTNFGFTKSISQEK